MRITIYTVVLTHLWLVDGLEYKEYSNFFSKKDAEEYVNRVGQDLSKYDNPENETKCISVDLVSSTQYELVPLS